MAESLENNIKELGRYPTEAISIALDQAINESGDNTSTTRDQISMPVLQAVKLLRSTPKKKSKKSAATPSDSEIFNAYIIPQLRRKIAELESEEAKGNIIQWQLNMNFNTDFTPMSLAELTQAHHDIVYHEKCMEYQAVIVKYFRGLLYLYALDQKPENVKVHDWFPSTFNVCYNTGMRYAKITALLMKFPRLLACGFTHGQLDKHLKSFDSYLLKTQDGLRESISTGIEIIANDRKMYFAKYENVLIPQTKHKAASVDHVYTDVDMTPDAELAVALGNIKLEPKDEAYDSMIQIRDLGFKGLKLD